MASAARVLRGGSWSDYARSSRRRYRAGSTRRTGSTCWLSLCRVQERIVSEESQGSVARVRSTRRPRPGERSGVPGEIWTARFSSRRPIRFAVSQGPQATSRGRPDLPFSDRVPGGEACRQALNPSCREPGGFPRRRGSMTSARSGSRASPDLVAGHITLSFPSHPSRPGRRQWLAGTASPRAAIGSHSSINRRDRPALVVPSSSPSSGRRQDHQPTSVKLSRELEPVRLASREHVESLPGEKFVPARDDQQSFPELLELLQVRNCVQPRNDGVAGDAKADPTQAEDNPPRLLDPHP